MVRRIFTEHPRSVGESYGEHMGQALFFARHLSLAAASSLVHAFLPFLFTRSASRRVGLLHERMVANRHKAVTRAPAERDAVTAE